MNETTVQEFHLSQKFLVIITRRTQNITQNLDEVFQILWTNGFLDSHVLIQEEEKSWSLHTFLPYQNDCFALTHLKLITFTPFNISGAITLSFQSLYPLKLKNFHKCPLYVAITISNPFIISHNTSDGMYRFEGIDTLIIEQISKVLNFTIVYKLPSTHLKRGTILKNGTAVGAFGLVYKMKITFKK